MVRANGNVSGAVLVVQPTLSGVCEGGEDGVKAARVAAGGTKPQVEAVRRHKLGSRQVTVFIVAEQQPVGGVT